jgi:hypothetical protein
VKFIPNALDLALVLRLDLTRAMTFRIAIECLQNRLGGAVDIFARGEAMSFENQLRTLASISQNCKAQTTYSLKGII